MKELAEGAIIATVLAASGPQRTRLLFALKALLIVPQPVVDPFLANLLTRMLLDHFITEQEVANFDTLVRGKRLFGAQVASKPGLVQD